MLKLPFRTFPFLLIRMGIFLLSGAISVGLVLLARAVLWNLTADYRLLQIITQPMALIIGLGAGAFIHRYVIRWIVKLWELVHVIATTTVLLDIRYKSTLIGFAMSEVRKNFLQVTSAAVLSSKGVKGLQKLKKALLENDVVPIFNQPESRIGGTIYSLVIYNIRMSLDTLDDIVTSYTWFATYLYDMAAQEPDEVNDAGEEIPPEKRKRKRKPPLTSRMKNQAIFMLEGLVLYIRVMPKMLVWGFAQMLVIELIAFLISAAKWVSVIFLVGMSWTNFAILFVGSRVIFQILHSCVTRSLQTDLALHRYYTEMMKLESVTPDMVQALVQKVPILGGIAKKTGLPEYKDIATPTKEELEGEDVSGLGGGLVSPDDLRDTLRDMINDTAKIFQVNEENLLTKPGESGEPSVFDEMASATPEPELEAPPEEPQVESVTEEAAALEPAPQEAEEVSLTPEAAEEKKRKDILQSFKEEF
jgi:hypothetical protein